MWNTGIADAAFSTYWNVYPYFSFFVHPTCRKLQITYKPLGFFKAGNYI